MSIRPIETTYRGRRFRSRLEARWAVFFDALELSWEYEPQGFHLSDGSLYLPDFLIAGGVWAEVKPAHAADSEFDKARLFEKDMSASDPSCTVLLLSGLPHTGLLSRVSLVHNSLKFSPVYYGGLETGCWTEHDILLQKAVDAALGARFEHGESGAKK